MIPPIDIKSQDWLRIRSIHSAMLQRCFNQNCPDYVRYGARGITVSDEWVGNEGAIRFYWWSMQNNYEPTLTIDRIDYYGPYASWNCRWATYKQQANNRRSNHLVDYGGDVYTLTEWAEIAKIDAHKLSKRLQAGWPDNAALFLADYQDPAETIYDHEGYMVLIEDGPYLKPHLGRIKNRRYRVRCGIYLPLDIHDPNEYYGHDSRGKLNKTTRFKP